MVTTREQDLGFGAVRTPRDQAFYRDPPGADRFASVKQLIAENPAACLAVAVLTGVTLGWLIKRQ